MLSLVTQELRSAPRLCAVTSAATDRSAASGSGWQADEGEPAKAGNPRLAELAEQVRRICARGRAPLPCCPSGLPALDGALGGGFAGGNIHELVGPREGAAAHSVALLTAAHAAGLHKWVFYIDTAGDFYPPGAAQLGVPLERLVVIRAPHRADALWVCEQTLRCRSVGAVVMPLRWLDAYVSRRLQLAAEMGQNLGLLVRTEADERARGRGGGAQRQGGAGHTFAATRLRFEPLSGGSEVRRMRVTFFKLRSGQPREPFVLEVPDGGVDRVGMEPGGAVEWAAERRAGAVS